MEGIYKVNVIASDLSTEETVLQIADTLDNLNGIVDDVFARILNRINQNMHKTKQLSDRIDISRAKVEKLTGMQKAIKVFSSAKYPASIKHEHYQSVFDLNGYKHKPKQINLSGKSQRLANAKSLQEKLHFYHVKVAELEAPKAKHDFNLNAVIDNIESISELLIFNTNESPYLGTLSKTAASVPAVSSKVVGDSLLEDAPSSIMRRDVLRRETDEYMYTPGIGMVPELEMPLDLPNLAGIAGDVQFSITTDGSIAPSVVTSPVAPTVPECVLPELPELLPAIKAPTLRPEVPSMGHDSRSDMPDAPPPVQVTAPALPPPPPPPPPPPIDPEPPIEAKRQEKPQPSAAPVGDAHANLMEAIRNAGGAGRAKLRSAEHTTPATGSKAPAGDLMADLHAKLSMRRRGMSGVERAGGTVLHALANIIPEPEGSSQRSSSSDDDWE